MQMFNIFKDIPGNDDCLIIKSTLIPKSQINDEDNYQPAEKFQICF